MTTLFTILIAIIIALICIAWGLAIGSRKEEYKWSSIEAMLKAQQMERQIKFDNERGRNRVVYSDQCLGCEHWIDSKYCNRCVTTHTRTIRAGKPFVIRTKNYTYN